ncbi:Glutathione gamma-glutamylcysteinyltransferase 3 [Glycine max]|nr:Glutathione gamma-glutamylcysteinyltransferase 3 [Glycine max]
MLGSNRYMIISRLNRAPSILYIVSYRHEGWSSVAKSLTEDVPRLLKSEDLKDIQEVLSLAFKSPPSELRGLITWIVEVRRQEDGNLTLSEEEKGRLAIKADILEQIRTTRLFKHVTRLGLSGGKCCSQIDVKHMNADSENPVTLVSGTVTTGGGSEQGVDVLVPLCQREPSRLCLSNEGHCIGMHPSTADVLTMFLLALPLHTWSGIKEEKLRVEALNPLATEDLPPLLQEESSLTVVPAIEVVSNDNVQIHKWKQPTVCLMKANLDAFVKKNIGTSMKSLLQHLWLFLAARNLM